ncbi:phage tail spike protein [Streptococcus sp. E17BB]|uniref:phage tail spike protein n=1 Tax=Streptococcus sp. E17BB TaxID=3278714 RepID=UPI00359E3241
MIYLFDKDENLIKIVRKTAVKTALQTYSLTTEKYVSDRLTVELKALPDDELEKVEYMAIQAVDDTHNFHFFYVAQKHSEGKLTELIGVQSGIEELRKTPVYDKRPKNAFAREVISDLLLGTNWSARFVDETLPRSTNFYYTSVFDALKKVCKVWDLEMQFFVQMNGNQIGARVIDFKKKIGAAVGKRVVYGHNALKILQEVERTNIYTALIGRGKGEQVSTADTSETVDGKSRQQQADGYGRKITFEDVVWRISDGKPVNKPKGQKYVELPEMTAHFGIKQADGSMRPKIGFVEFSEEEDKEVVLQKTYEALVDTSRPQVTFKTSTVYLKGAAIGDTIRVVRHDKRIDYDTRIFELTINRLNDQSSDVKLGDRITEGQASRIQTIADQAVDNFIQNEFSNFVQNLPDFLPSADGANTNWYGAEDPTVKYKGKVVINDIWYKPDPEHEGHKIMLRWTGEAWEELVRTADNERVKRLVEEVQAKANELTQQAQAADQKASEALTRAGASSDLAKLAKETADRAAASSTQTGQELANKSRELQEAVRLTRENLSSQADQIRRQAQTQEGLSSRLMTVEETANGTKTTLTELSKTVNSTTGNLTSVTQRVASVETGLSGVREQYSQLNQTLNTTTGQVQSVSQKTADIERGLDGVRERFENIRVGGVNLIKRTGEPFVMGYGITNTAWDDETKRTRLTFGTGVERARNGEILPQGRIFEEQRFVVKQGQTYTQAVRVSTDARFIGIGSLQMSWYGPEVVSSANRHRAFSAQIKQIGTNEYLVWCTVNWTTPDIYLRPFDIFNLHTALDFRNSGTYLEFYQPKLEIGNIPTDYSPADEDFRQEFAEYKRSVDENSAELGRRVQGLDGSLSETKTLAQQTAEGIRQLATKTEVNAVTGRLSTAESSIRQQADQIAQRLTRAEVDNLVTTKGYISNTVFDNYKRETAQTIERGLTETRGLIPTKGSSVNLVPNSKINESSNAYGFGTRTIQLEAGKTYWFLARAKKTGGTSDKRTRVYIYKSDWQESYNLEFNSTNYETKSIKFTARYTERYAISTYWFPGGGDRSGTADIDWYMVAQSDLEPTEWSPAPQDLASAVDFNKVKETAQLYERALGTTNQGIADNIARMVMTSNIFQVEVGKVLTKSDNLVYDPTNYSRHQPRSTSNAADYYMTGTNTYKLLVIRQTGHTAHQWRGFQVPLRTATFTKGEKLSYRVNLWVDVLPDDIISFEIKNAGTIIGSFQIMPTKTGAAQIFTGTFTVNSDTIVTDDYGLHVWLRKNGQVAVGQISIVRGEVPPDRFVDSTSAQEVATSTLVTQLADSYAIKTLNSNGAVLSAVNVATGGIALQAGQNKLVVTPSTVYVQDGTIKNAMIESVLADKVTAGTLNAANVNIINLNANKIVGLDANFIKSKIETALVDWLKGKVITAQNDAMRINLNQANISFNQNATIEFLSNNNSLRRMSPNKPSQFIRLIEGNFYSELGVLPNSTLTVIGSNSDQSESSENDGFGGVRIWNGVKNQTEKTTFVELVGNRVAIYGNKNRSPWLFDMTGKASYLIPQNEGGITHSLGRSDRRFADVQSQEMHLSGKSLKTVINNIYWHLTLLYAGNHSYNHTNHMHIF